MVSFLPYRIYLDITNNCPHSCLHCYANSGKALEKELSLDELKDLVRQMIDLGVYNLIISGGEPLTRPDIFEFLYFCRENKLKTILLTSGILLNKRNTMVLKNLGIELRLSLDGISEKTHDFVRGKGSFQTVTKILDMLKKELDNISIHFTINRINVAELLNLPYFLNQLKIRDIVLSTIKPSGRVLEHPELLIEPSLTSLIKQRINVISKSKNIKIRTYPEKNWQGLSCPAAFAKCGITSDGRITPCVFLGKDFLGDSLRNYPLRYLWHNDKTLNKLRNLAVNDSCKNCLRLSINNGGCRARAMYFNGHIEEVDPYCCEIKKQSLAIEELIPLYKGG